MNKTTIVTMLAILICLLAWTKGWADECTEKELGQTDMNLCAIDVSKKADLELEAVYKKLMKKISPKGRAKLREAQKAWDVYRKKQCEFETLGSDGGTVYSMVLSYCHAYMTNEHKKLLLKQLECEEYDLSCGNQ